MIIALNVFVDTKSTTPNSSLNECNSDEASCTSLTLYSKAPKLIIRKLTVTSPGQKSIPFSRRRVIAKTARTKARKDGRAREETGGCAKERRGEIDISRVAHARRRRRRRRREAHASGKHSARERISPYWFSLKPLSLSASRRGQNARSRSRRLFHRAVKARDIDFWQLLYETRSSSLAYIYRV